LKKFTIEEIFCKKPYIYSLTLKMSFVLQEKPTVQPSRVFFKHEISSFFLSFWTNPACLDPDPDSQAGSGSFKPIENRIESGFCNAVPNAVCRRSGVNYPKTGSENTGVGDSPHHRYGESVIEFFKRNLSVSMIRRVFDSPHQ
jgi:hypothetical protein